MQCGPEAAARHLSITRADPGIRRDARKALRGLNPRHTLAAAEQLSNFDRPALVVWSTEEQDAHSNLRAVVPAAHSFGRRG